MPKKSKKILLCLNPDCDEDYSVTLEAKKALERAGYEAVISVVQLRRASCIVPEGLDSLPFEEAVADADLLITFGGDGTILKVARAVMKKPLPLLGVNLGHKGFMAELEPHELPLMLKAAAGEYNPVRRMMLDVELIRDNACVFSDSALNDAVVGGSARAINITAYGDGAKISAYSGDGIIIATPTGSTAYSLSAGGPLVESTAENILLTPVCAHLMNARPFVLAPDRTVTVRLDNNPGKMMWLSVDGCEPISIYDGDELKIKKSSHYTLIAHVSQKSFYERAFEKLGG